MKQIEEVTLPDGWHWEEIGPHIADFRSGIARGQKSRKEGYPHLRMNNISNELRLSLAELWRIPASDAELKDFALRDDDVLFNNTNSRDLVGKTCLFRHPSDETFLFSNHITRIRTKESLSAHYFVFWLNHLWRRGIFREKCDVWVNQAAVRVEDLIFPTKLPLSATREDQDRVALGFEQRVAALENARLAGERQLEASTTLEQSFLRTLFPLADVKNTPSSWSVQPLRELRKSIEYGLSKTSSRIPVGPKYVRITDIQDGEVNWDSVPHCECSGAEAASCKLQDGDILFARTGATTGKSYLISNPPTAVFASYLIRVQCNVERVLPEYLYAFFQSHIYWKAIGKDARGGAQPGFNATMLSDMLVPLPPTKDDQAQIAGEFRKHGVTAQRIKRASKRQLEAVSALPSATFREFFNFGNGVHA
ncbi:MAG: restriction endonuclease subunit S [Verrucomicrobia bacterium]|nr:restriction endonuclease subunit S [Verrucomicrobiota bacterium]